jgi:hypothetical protein
MGCCQSEDNLFFAMEELIEDLLKTLKIRKLGEEQLRKKLNTIYQQFNSTNEKEKYMEALEDFLIDETKENHLYIDFQKKFVRKLFEKVGDLSKKNVSIFFYPLLKNVENLALDNFFILLTEKYGEKLSYDHIYKEFIQIVEFYTHDLTDLLKDHLNNKVEKDFLTEINQNAFSYVNLKKFVSSLMDKDELIRGDIWKERVTFKLIDPIFKKIGIDCYTQIRNNVISLEL